MESYENDWSLVVKLPKMVREPRPIGQTNRPDEPSQQNAAAPKEPGVTHRVRLRRPRCRSSAR